ncbi:MAG: DUF368 domain-containing protein [Flavobacteriaceae bacterium]
MKRNFIDYLVLVVKGMAMGAADLVPGVSGGTIAFISGIYEELIQSLSNFNIALIKDLKTLGIGPVWKKINGAFLLALFGGVSISLFSLSKLVSWLIKEKPIAIWSFFFGLVLASILFMIKKIKHWNIKTYSSFIIGTLVAYAITTMDVNTHSSGLLFLFFSGALAICAMILPGISGAFILILLGSYYNLLEAINGKDFVTISVFILGALIGILSFSKLLKWLLDNYKTSTLAVLTGFMAGALVKIWPWKFVQSSRLNSKGELVPFLEECVSPLSYDGDPKISIALSLMFAGFILITVLENIGTKSNE